MPQQVICTTCNGRGKIGIPFTECPTCAGNGKIPDITTCPICLGLKYVGEDPCPTCFMQGSVPLHDVQAEMFKKMHDIENRQNDILNKCNDILEAIQNP